MYKYILLLIVLLLSATAGCTCNVSEGNVYFNCEGSLLPCADNAYNLGDPTHQWANIYTYTLSPFELNAPLWNDLVVNMSNARPPASLYPTWTSYKLSQVPAFDDDSINVLYFSAQLPHNYLEGSDLEFHVHVAYPDNVAGNSRWYMTYSWANVDEDFPAADSAFTIATSPTTTDRHQLISIMPAIDGAGKLISSVLLCSIQRTGSDASDTYPNVIYLISGDFHYQVDTMGSHEQLVK